MIVILLVDNNIDFLDTFAEILERAEFRVLKASTLEQARGWLSESHIHLVLLDIRMRDDDDPRDVSGLTLAKDETYRQIPKVILTDYPRSETAVEALRRRPDGPPWAVDYIEKKTEIPSLIQAIEHIVAEYIPLNLDLQIHWQTDGTPISFAQLACLVESDLNPERLPDRIYELEDLCRKLFRDYEQVTIARTLWHKQNRAALEVHAYSQDREMQYIVIYGHHNAMAAAHEKYIHAMSINNAQFQLSAETVHYAAIGIVLNNCDMENLVPFGTFYREHTEKTIRQCLEFLYQNILPLWHQQRRTVHDAKGLADFYLKHLNLHEKRASPEKLELRVEALAQQGLARGLIEITLTADQWLVRLPGEEQSTAYPNPMQYVYRRDWIPSYQAIYTISPGCLDTRTMLVDSEATTWLSDFGKLGITPLEHDFVALEAAIRFRLLKSRNLRMLGDFESELLKAMQRGSGTSINNVEPECWKALRAIQVIHDQAREVLGNRLGFCYVGLLFYAVAGIMAYNPTSRYTDLEIAHFLHRLVLSAMLCQVIQRQGEQLFNAPPTTYPELKLDKANLSVRMGEREISLPPKPFAVLDCLYQCAGETCTRLKIVKTVWEMEKPTSDEQRYLVNANIERLRKRIEPDPGNPQYIITVRGRGYQLITQP